jgi:hypothetical protein
MAARAVISACMNLEYAHPHVLIRDIASTTDGKMTHYYQTSIVSAGCASKLRET